MSSLGHGSTLVFELFPTRTLLLLPYRNVRNMQHLLAYWDHPQGSTGSLPCDVVGGLLDPAMIISPFQIQIAANIVLNRQASNTMKTKNLFNELKYTLSAENNISKSLTLFGCRPLNINVIVALFDASPSSVIEAHQLIDGEPMEMDTLICQGLCDRAAISKHYKISSQSIKGKALKASTKDLIKNDDLTEAPSFIQMEQLIAMKIAAYDV